MDKKIDDIKKYIRKLHSVLLNEASFSFFSNKFVNKQRIDDIICCIDANWPDKIKTKNKREERFFSEKVYIMFVKNITQKTFISSSLYKINYNEFLQQSGTLLKAIETDYKKMNNI